MNQKLPADAFNFYHSLGPDRSYETVAAKYDVSRRGVAEHAKREGWQTRIADLERQARVRSDQKVLETLEEMNDRHLKVLHFTLARALEGMKAAASPNFADSSRTALAVIAHERLIRGQPTERTESTIEEISRREYARWLKKSDDTESSEAPAKMPEASVEAPRYEPSADLAPPPSPSPPSSSSEEGRDDAGAVA